VILRRNERDTDINVHISLHIPRYSCQILIKTEYAQHISKKIQKYRILQRSFHCEPKCFVRSDGQTDMTKSIFAFRNSAKARKTARNDRISFVVETVDTMCQTFV